MKYSRILPTLLLALLLAAGSADADKYAGEFMAKGTGARPLAMGGAFSAVADDANAVYFNPGALAFQEKSSASLMHSERFGGLVQVDHGAFLYHADLNGRPSTLAFSVLRVGVDEILFTGDHPFNDLDGNGEFSGPEELPAEIDPSYFRTVQDAEWAVHGAYSRMYGDWAVGAALKVIYQSVGEYNSFGFGLDAGILSPLTPGNLRFGLRVADLSATFIAWNTGVQEIIRPSLRPGVSWRKRLPALQAELLLASDLDIRFDSLGSAADLSLGLVSVDPHLGMELTLLEVVSLRAGYDAGDWTLGGGLHLLGKRGFLPAFAYCSELTLDYGFGSHEELDGSHRVGLALRF
ncbi:MAG: hypothetical protein QF492_04755 [Candidatus Krumholzibacteria bacterium]|jgi:hypothetical protein|nr:hypothetical protein [Candidatus Krumholzibacteria bacterium]MDP6669202.1 hypothetical protein [Candidatus Krumholzibacteria bacterium]MDP6796604.1 hypothetical protein [Candidatus Krumholzibacteria bacterium]MDP7020930.1 hypothetical protein [Candidatus Krumholzibacteria bacterium]